MDRLYSLVAIVLLLQASNVNANCSDLNSKCADWVSYCNESPGSNLYNYVRSVCPTTCNSCNNIVGQGTVSQEDTTIVTSTVTAADRVGDDSSEGGDGSEEGGYISGSKSGGIDRGMGMNKGMGKIKKAKWRSRPAAKFTLSGESSSNSAKNRQFSTAYAAGLVVLAVGLGLVTFYRESFSPKRKLMYVGPIEDYGDNASVSPSKTPPRSQTKYGAIHS